MRKLCLSAKSRHFWSHSSVGTVPPIILCDASIQISLAFGKWASFKGFWKSQNLKNYDELQPFLQHHVKEFLSTRDRMTHLPCSEQTWQVRRQTVIHFPFKYGFSRFLLIGLYGYSALKPPCSYRAICDLSPTKISHPRSQQVASIPQRLLCVPEQT